MNHYLMSIERYFSGEETFEIKAENKTDAVEKGRKLYERDDMHKVDSIRVKKKLNKKS